MTRPILSDRMVAQLRALVPSHILQAATVHAMGGNTWAVSRPVASDGVNAPGSPTAPGAVTGYAVSPKVASLGGTLVGTSVAADQWKLYTDTDQDLRVNDTITNQSDSSLKFLVLTKDTQLGFVVYHLEPTT